MKNKRNTLSILVLSFYFVKLSLALTLQQSYMDIVLVL